MFQSTFEMQPRLWATMQEHVQVLGSLQLARPWLDFGLTGQDSDKSRHFRSSLEITQRCPCVPAASAPVLRSSAWLRGHPCNPPNFPNDMHMLHILVPTPMSQSRSAHRFSALLVFQLLHLQGLQLCQTCLGESASVIITSQRVNLPLQLRHLAISYFGRNRSAPDIENRTYFECICR